MRTSERSVRARAQARPDGVLAVAGDLTFETVPEIYAESRAWFERANGRVTVDLAEVERADSAGLALLLEW
ncbi:MAG TPA: STAS domain-containing protein, partial [Burkholderiales bacterium]